MTSSTPHPEGSDPGPVAAASRRILVVDDNRDAARSLALLLRMAGNETHTVFDGPEAVTAVATLEPDVVLLDIGLPKMNGYETCRRIRQQPRGEQIVVVAVTGWGQESVREKTREAGFNGHLVKPVELAELTNVLNELLPQGTTPGSTHVTIQGTIQETTQGTTQGT